MKPLRFKTKPMAHQREEFFRYRKEKARARFWTMRTGKTKITIDEFSYLYHIGEITGVIIIAPNTVHENWIINEIPKHCPVEYNGLTYRPSISKRKYFLELMRQSCMNRDKLQIIAVASSSLRTETAKSFLKTFLKKHEGKVFVVYDEAHDFKKPGSARTRVAIGVSRLARFKRLLTGTPIHGSPMNLYSEFELLEHNWSGYSTFDFKRLPDGSIQEGFKQHFGYWEERTTRAGRTFIAFVGPRNEDELRAKVEKYTTVLRREDVPGLMKPLDIERKFTLTEPQRKLYDSLMETPVLDGEVLDGGVFLQKLQQITSGFINTKSRGIVELVKPEDNPRFNLIMNEIMKAEGKVIVWLHYHYEFDVLRKLLTAEEIGFSEVHGQVKNKSHIHTIKAFGQDESKKVIFGHTLSGGVGGDYSFCNTIIWGSHTFDLIQRDQGSERGTQIGKLPVDLIDIIGVQTVDTYTLSALKRKINIADRIAGTGLVDLKRELAEFQQNERG